MNWNDFLKGLSDSERSRSNAWIHRKYWETLRPTSQPCSCKVAADAIVKSWSDPIEFGTTPFDRAAQDIYARLQELADAVSSGAMLPSEFEDAMMAILVDAHISAHEAGQVMSGYQPSAAVAKKRGTAIALGQVAYVRSFAKALAERDSRYWDDAENRWKRDAVSQRAGMYLGRTRGTATDGWIVAAPQAQLFDWTLGAVEVHCDDCPILAAGSPYLGVADTGQLDYPTLFTKPGEGDTPCLFNCKCHLVRLSDGAESPLPFQFQIEDENAAAAA